MLIVRNSFLLLHTNDIAHLACSNAIVSVGKTRLGVKMAMHPGFLRAGWQPEILFFDKWHGSTYCLSFLYMRDSWQLNRTT
jgi:hypothetical protein